MGQPPLPMLLPGSVGPIKTRWWFLSFPPAPGEAVPSPRGSPALTAQPIASTARHNIPGLIEMAECNHMLNLSLMVSFWFGKCKPVLRIVIPLF